MMELPIIFEERMKQLLGEEYKDFRGSYETERSFGLRVNPLKADIEGFASGSFWKLRKVPWAAEGYSYDGEDRPGKHPLHDAGVYYIQEPSAMAVVQLLDPRPGDIVLDLCAAPGGKSTQIAGRLGGKGMLVSNEIHPERARILSQNVERMGIRNAVVTNEDPKKLSKHFPEFFDKIVVDAPCSGEGMFRKDETARREWSPAHVAMCARRQQDILDMAAGMLKPGGRMVYSTCTFAPEEDEDAVYSFLKAHGEFSVEVVPAFPSLSGGNPGWTSDPSDAEILGIGHTWRIWPHRSEGEGHYLAVLKKAKGSEFSGKRRYPSYVKDRKLTTDYEKFCQDTFVNPENWSTKEELLLFGDQLYLLPEQMTELKGLKVLRPGLHLGTLKKNRFEPSHALALHLKQGEVKQWYSLPSSGDAALKYLKGEVLDTAVDGGTGRCSNPGQKGWLLMLADSYSLGWGKVTGTIIKNHYPKGIRRLG